MNTINMTKQEQRDPDYEVYEAGREQAYELYRDRADREQAYKAELEKIKNEIKWVMVVAVVGMIAVNFITLVIVN